MIGVAIPSHSPYHRAVPSPGTKRFLLGLSLIAAGTGFAYSFNHTRTGQTSLSRGEEDASTVLSRPPRNEAQPAREVALSPESVFEAPYFDLGRLDFDALRDRAPENLYWLMAAPTDDPELLERRRIAKEQRNEQYGKVLASTASIEEIEDYYAYRRSLSEDYVEIAQLILDRHGEELSERDAGLFELTIAMHSARLAQMPTEYREAVRRKSEYDQVKRAWQEQQREEAQQAR